MKNHYLMLSLVFLATSCSLTVQIDTDYASQNKSDGEIQEKVTTEATSENSSEVATTLEGTPL